MHNNFHFWYYYKEQETEKIEFLLSIFILLIFFHLEGDTSEKLQDI